MEQKKFESLKTDFIDICRRLKEYDIGFKIVKSKYFKFQLIEKFTDDSLNLLKSIIDNLDDSLYEMAFKNFTYDEQSKQSENMIPNFFMFKPLFNNLNNGLENYDYMQFEETFIPYINFDPIVFLNLYRHDVMSYESVKNMLTLIENGIMEYIEVQKKRPEKRK